MIRGWRSSWPIAPLLLLAAACDGVFSLHGQVKDASGSALPGAVVTVYGKAFPDSGLRTVTDAAGSFGVFQVTAPFGFAARVEISKTGHRSVTAVIPDALKPHRISVRLESQDGGAASEIKFENPSVD